MLKTTTDELFGWTSKFVLGHDQSPCFHETSQRNFLSITALHKSVAIHCHEITQLLAAINRLTKFTNNSSVIYKWLPVAQKVKVTNFSVYNDEFVADMAKVFGTLWPFPDIPHF